MYAEFNFNLSLFSTELQCDVLWWNSFTKMKLVTTIFFIIKYAVYVNSNEQFVFPPKFQTPGTFVSEGSLYLPPESHTPIPYFPVKKFGNLPFPYLPPTATKSPIPFPSPFPLMFSSTHNYDDDEDVKKDDERENNRPSSTSRPPFPFNNRNNKTENSQGEHMAHKRDMRQIQKPMHYQQPIDRVDVRLPHQLPIGFSTPTPMNQKPTPRSMIISVDNHDNIFDQIKAGSSQGGQYAPPPGVFISSTTEPAIPILRLSNEMDLDGSFSYEALGADQTHYVQHSHMENQGTDKEEQVVEGSYSYVGDNGQTYTVHYVADSNGFRASGDHLPVAPPIPEIIQRAIQYNLAEEAKKPPHLKSWQAEEQERENNEIHDRNQRFSIPPPRNLFTGKTPEAFSYDFAQRSPNTQNNLEAAASSQSVKTVDFNNNQQKQNVNSGTIAPQVTFLASQGAHVPSINTPQQTVSRMFTNEKQLPSLPQLVNYEADDNNKALWRWQYGLNSNNQILNHANPNSEKNSISRSSGDDIVINFNEMTPEQYTNMLQSQISTDSIRNMDNKARNYDHSPVQENTNVHNNDNENIDSKENIKYHKNNENTRATSSVEKTQTQQYIDWYKNFINNNADNPYFPQLNQQNNPVTSHQDSSTHDIKSTTASQVEQKFTNANENSPYFRDAYDKQDSVQNRQESQGTYTYSTIINQVDPNASKFVTQTYNFEDISYEPKRIKAINQYTTTKPNVNYRNYITNDEYLKLNTPSYSTQNSMDIEKGSTLIVTQAPSTTAASDIKFTDFINPDDTESFKPIIKTANKEKRKEITESVEDPDLSKNIFLKNIIQANKQEPKPLKINEIDEKKTHKKIAAAETKSDKVAKYISVQNKPFNDITMSKKKPIDLSEIINFITMKNHFESSKISKPKNNPQNFGDHKPRNEIHYLPVDDKDNDEEFDHYSQKQINNGFPNIYPQLGELRGNIKNYKVLQRNNNLNTGYEKSQLKRELVPPPVKLLQSQNLPPLGRAGPSTRSYLPPIYV